MNKANTMPETVLSEQSTISSFIIRFIWF